MNHYHEHGQPFRIRHEKTRVAPPGKGMTKKSYPVGNKTSLSPKPCIADKKVTILNTFRKSWSLSNFYKKTAYINFKNLSDYKML